MPFISKPSHKKRFIRHQNFDARFSDIKQVISSLLQLDIDPSLKYSMLVHAIWKITELEGSFNGRYRSKDVMVPDCPIRRDHVIQKEGIVRRLIADPVDIETILCDVIHCVVTKAEHDQLTAYSKANVAVDGWDRYKAVGITVIDMLSGNQLTWAL